jgi:hypothetical protein
LVDVPACAEVGENDGAHGGGWECLRARAEVLLVDRENAA